MDVSKWMMVGVVGIGLYAVYRMTQTSSATPQTTAANATIAKAANTL